MFLAPTLDPVAPAEPDLDQVRDLYAQGLCFQAYTVAQALGPLPRWRGPAARILAGRLAMNLGAPRLAFWHHIKAWREDRADPEACYYYARGLLERRGPLAAWNFLQRTGALPAAPAPVHSDWLAFHACVLGVLRDFEAAEQWLARAEEACPGQPWTCIERAHLLEFEDRYEASLAASRRALELRPWYRPGVQAVAHTLQLLDRDREALDLLTEANQHIESGPAVAQMALLQTELGHHADARRSYARFAELAPLIEKDVAQWLAARRCDAAYYAGDFAEAAEFARQVDGPFYPQLAEHLTTTPDEGRRVLLDVGFVRQHYQTCAPATLAALSRFWKMPADHLEVAEAICYDGTPDHRERHWLEQHGWRAREFTITWESAVALLNRGIPFTLTTTEPANAHMQAIIGYDSRRGSLLVRDPYQRYLGEFIADATLERYRSTGPRGVALVPLDQAGVFDGLPLPDADLYDRLYQLQRALQEYDRSGGDAAYATMQAEAPGHRLTLQARRVLALYDADQVELLATVEELLGLFPADGLLQFGKLACLRHLGRRDERLALLGDVCARPDSDPVFRRCHAQELAADAREHARAIRLLRRAIRVRPVDPGNFASLANLLWDQRRLEEAMELYRFAACLDDKDEGLARSYFAAARHLKQTDATLHFLEQRFERFGARSSQPARTLFWAYNQFERTTEAAAVLEKALQLRPDDGELLLFAAEAANGHGDFERAARLLAAAEGRAPQPACLRTAAQLAESRGEPLAALGLWRQVLEAEPLAFDANRAAAQLLAETDSRTAALEHLKQACARFPHNFPLHQLWIEWLRNDGPTATEPVVRQVIAIHPADAWARRELALSLSMQGRHDQAFAELELAHGLEPASTTYYGVRGQVCALAGRRAEAREAYQEAIRLSVDNDFAISQLVETSDTLAERRAALAFVEEELVRQVIFGDGLLVYQQYAQHTLEPEELLGLLQKALDARPDLWHAWSAVVRQLSSMERNDEAFDVARRATVRFPLQARLWLDLATVCQARQDHDGEVEALQHALQINPGWGMALRRLAELHERDGQMDESRAVLERAATRNPLDGLNHGCLADVLWRLGQKEAALEHVQHALRLDPGYEWAWTALRDWSHQLDRPQLASDVARDLTVRRAGEARSWLMLARTLNRAEERDERLVALDRALALNPRLFDACDLKAELLANASRFDEARAVCQTAAWGPQPPLYLRGRAAWIEAQRGQVPQAIEQMRGVVAEDTDYYWGWYNLADWYRDIGAAADYLEAATHLVRLAPQNPVAFGYRGEARLRSGDRAAAKEDFRRAVKLAPTYGFAGLTLFDVQLDDSELEAAGQTLHLLKKHLGSDDYVLAREVQWTCRRDDRLTAVDCLRQLSLSAQEDDWPLDTAVAAMQAAGWSTHAERILKEALDSPAVHPQAGVHWINLCAERKDWTCAAHLDGLLAKGEVGRRALLSYVRVLGTARQPRRLRRCVQRYRDLLREDARGWGAVGDALTTAADHRAAVQWSTDWAERPGVQPWMFINLVLALRALGRGPEANRVSRHALTLPADGTSAPHALWLAFDEALAGDTAAATDRLAKIGPVTFDATHRFVRALLEAILAVQQAAAGERRRVFRQVRGQLREAAQDRSPLVEDRQTVRRVYRECVRRLARDCPSLRGRLWSAWRQVWPLVPARAALPSANRFQ